MQTFKDMSQAVRDHVASLSVNAKVIIGSFFIVVVIAASIASLYLGGSSTETLPLSLGPDTRQETIQYLATSGLDWHEADGLIHVPVGQRDHVISRLSEEGIISPDQVDFDSMVRDENIFLTKGQQETRTRIATQNVLAGMIARMRDIQSATVVISGGDDSMGLGRAFIERSASVTVLSKEHGIDMMLVDAIARMVAGATHGLRVESVAVIDARTGRSFYASSPGAASSDSDLLHATQMETQVVLRDLLGYIPGVRVHVHASRMHEIPSLEATPVTSPLPSMSGPEPDPLAARANLLEELGIFLPSVNETADQSGTTIAQADEGDIDQSMVVNVSIAVPRRYMMDVHSMLHGDRPVDSATFDQLVNTTFDDIRSQVEAMLPGASSRGEHPGGISVTMFTETTPPAVNMEEASPSWLGMLADSQALRTIGLGTLAFLTLGMMFVILRRARGQLAHTRYESMATTGGSAIAVGTPGPAGAGLPGSVIESVAGNAVVPGTAGTRSPEHEEEIPGLVDHGPGSIMIFEDLLRLDDAWFSSLCVNVSESDLALSLKTASNELRARFFSNLPRAGTDGIIEAMEAIGPVHLCEIESAQERILETVRGLRLTTGRLG